MAKEGYKTGGYRISDIYQGSYSSLTPRSEYVTLMKFLSVTPRR